MARRKTSSRPAKTPTPTPSPIPTWDEHLIPRLLQWRVEIVGFLLFVFSAVMLLGLSGLTHSGFLAWVTGLSRQLLGWGAYVLFASGVAIGLHLLFRRTERPNWIRPKQIIGFELVLFAALALTHQLSTATFDDAYLGRAGGIAGWALTMPLQTLIGPFLTGLLFLILVAWGVLLVFNVTWADIIRVLVYASGRLRAWADAVDVDPDLVFANDATERELRELERAAVTQPVQNIIVPVRNAELPPLSLLKQGTTQHLSSAEIRDKARIIERTLTDFGLKGKVIQIEQGPTITQFGVEPGYLERPRPDGTIHEQKVRISQIAGLRADFALALAVPRLRIEAPVPGKGIVGIEVPNQEASLVRLRDILESAEFQSLQKPLAVGLGKTVSGRPVAVDLAKMPHLLIAGTTGSGKSASINALITCLTFNNTPDQLKLVLIDPKKVELIRFNGMPHMIGAVETDGERIIGVLRWLVAEMERRYEVFAQVGARQLESYNRRMVQQGQPPMPRIVLFIDELADLMAMYSAEVERTLCRLAQMARATGMHLVVATQRPSINVITGLIKANFPARIAFAVASNTDSRVIIDTSGAEQLLGRGDMLFLGPDAAAPQRVQGCFIDDDEIDRLAAFWQNAWPETEAEPPPWENLLKRMAIIEDTDDLLEQAINLCQRYDTISTSLLQRRLRVGFPRAARIMETLYEMGLVEDPKSGGKTRQTHVDVHDTPLDTYIENNGDELPSI
ncbi:MAG: DNA translocase FtsK [Anaerolineae bacterium]|nr:DNA translocase FtsK [Anaerolineae bacterium]MCO5196399.1 DNA translocase FtsK [Anaerolineae bacterium]